MSSSDYVPKSEKYGYSNELTRDGSIERLRHLKNMRGDLASAIRIFPLPVIKSKMCKHSAQRVVIARYKKKVCRIGI